MPWNLTPQAYGKRFYGFTFKDLSEILPNKNLLLDHLCNCIMEKDNIIPEAWP